MVGVIVFLLLSVTGLLAVAFIFVGDASEAPDLMAGAKMMAANRRAYQRIEREAMERWEDAFDPCPRPDGVPFGHRRLRDYETGVVLRTRHPVSYQSQFEVWLAHHSRGVVGATQEALRLCETSTDDAQCRRQVLDMMAMAAIERRHAYREVGR